MTDFNDEDAEMHYDPDDDGQEAGSVALAIKNRYESMLLETAGVEGVGLGVDPVGNETIVIYVRDSASHRNLPRNIEGTPVQFEVTGTIRAT